MAPKTRRKVQKRRSAKDPIPKQTVESKLYINTREDEGHCGASVRSEDTETALQDTANAAVNVSAAPLDSIEPVDPGESAEVSSRAVLPEWNERRRDSGLPTEDELEVANFLVTEDFRSSWASGSASDDVLVAADTRAQFKNDPNYSAPVQKESRPKRNQTRRSRRS